MFAATSWQFGTMMSNDLLLYESALALHDGTASITQDLDILKVLVSAPQIAQAVAEHAEPLFGCEVVDGTWGAAKFTATPMGRRLLRWLDQWHRVRPHFQGHADELMRLEAHPWAYLVLSMKVQGWPPVGKAANLAQVRSSCDALHHEVERLRKASRMPEFLMAVRRFERHSRDSARSLKRYLRALSAKHAKLLVLRLDLGYRHDPMTEPIGPRVTPVELGRHRDLMVRFFEKAFADTHLGYIVKTEFGLYKGPHLHAVFLLDGSRVRQDVSIATLLGKHWQSQVTAGRGTYFNCNGIKWKYLHAGIGLVDYRDPEDWLGAEFMVDYITKIDHFVRAWADGHRTLVKSWTPRLRENRRGRPRTKRYKNITAGVALRMIEVPSKT